MEDDLLPVFQGWKQLHKALPTPVPGQCAMLDMKAGARPFLVEYNGEDDEWEYVRRV